MTMFIKDAREFSEIVDGKLVHKSRLVISENGVDTEILIDNGKVRVTESV
ncbi:MAG: hypothetical protein MJ229_07980 [bacterium]|nr:hypothetical protein [bacterium]